jgi:hypothetical protein
LAHGLEPDWDDVSNFRVGTEFLMSLHKNMLSQSIAANLLQAIVDTIEGNSMARTHALRTGTGGGNPQLVRKSDQAKAWRRDVDSEHHLHYWFCEEGIVEFASMSFPHDDYSIPE